MEIVSEVLRLVTGCIVFLAGIDAQCEPCEADGCYYYAGVGCEAEREEGELCVQDAQCADGGDGLFKQSTVECCKADDGCPVGYALCEVHIFFR